MRDRLEFDAHIARVRELGEADALLPNDEEAEERRREAERAEYGTFDVAAKRCFIALSNLFSLFYLQKKEDGFLNGLEK